MIQHLQINAGHPADNAPGFDQLHLQSDQALDPVIQSHLVNGWQLWINGTMGHQFAASLFRQELSMNVFCFGSPTITSLPLPVAGAIATIINKQGRFILDDNPGVASRVQLFLTDEHYTEVAIFHLGDRPMINHGNFPTVRIPMNWEEKPIQQTREACIGKANFGLCLYDETNHSVFGAPAKHDRSLHLVHQMLLAHKPVKLFFAGCKVTLNLKTLADYDLIAATIREHYV